MPLSLAERNVRSVNSEMRLLILGQGGIGHRHLQNLRVLDPSIRVAICRHRGRGTPAADQADATLYGLKDALEWKPTAAIVASPAPFHIPQALALADAGVDLFIEKPLSDTLGDVGTLMERCQARGLVLMVGYNLRFDRSLQAARRAVRDDSIGRVVSLRAEVGQFLPDWRPQGDYRKTVTARRALGGGATLELSHEFDYVRWIVGEPVSVLARLATSGHLEIDCEDSADVLLSFADGATGTVHLDLLDRSAVRRCRIVGTEGTITWDGISRQAARFRPSEGWAPLDDGSDVRSDSYAQELEHFLGCVADRRQPLVTGEDGAKALAIALAAKASSETGRAIAL